MKLTLNKALILAMLMLSSSCTNLHEMYGVATGSSIGGMFGSAIGGLMGGPRGSDAGTVVGMLAGGVIGAAAVNNSESKSAYSERDYSRDYARDYSDEVAYDYTPQRQYSNNTYSNIVVRNVTFNDENGNHCLDSRERAYIILDIYNNGRSDAYEVAPVISCDNRHVIISPTAIISALPSGRGARYKAAVMSRGKLKNGMANFRVSFDGNNSIARTFSIQTRR